MQHTIISRFSSVCTARLICSAAGNGVPSQRVFLRDTFDRGHLMVRDACAACPVYAAQGIWDPSQKFIFIVRFFCNMDRGFYYSRKSEKKKQWAGATSGRSTSHGIKYNHYLKWSGIINYFIVVPFYIIFNNLSILQHFICWAFFQ